MKELLAKFFIGKNKIRSDVLKPKELFETILKQMGELTSQDVSDLTKAYDYAFMKYQGLTRLNGEEFFTHPLEVALILTQLNVDVVTIESAMLHEVMNHADVTHSELEEQFGSDIANIVDSISKINRLELSDDSESSAIYLRKVLVGIAEDVRVLFIKLADRVHNLRTSSILSMEKQKQKANETMSVLVPIAHRLGINSLKSELENLSLRILKPQVYEDILERLQSTNEELKDTLEEMQDSISNILIEHDLKFYIKSRVKSVYSIYNKLNHGKKWSNIYDILAMRIIVDNVSDCYTAIGLIHAKFRPIPGRFKDYIAMPKENMYQSLHTGVFGSNGARFEIQIRTWEMDEIAENGIASHWSYKEQGVKKVQSMMEQKLEVFRNFIEMSENDSDVEFEHSAHNDFLDEFIYVFTPKGDVVELPKNSTPVDFAYRIHSDIGDHIVSALVNDLIVPLNYELSDHDVIEVKTNPRSNPNKEWLSFVKTSHAKTRIKSFFSKLDREFYVTKGKDILEKELRKRKLTFDSTLSSENIKKICSDLKIKNLEEIYLAIGSLRYTAGYVIDLTIEDKKNVQDVLIEKMSRHHSNVKSFKSDIIVSGEANILTNLAKCCKPIYGDEITGYITKGEGVSVHQKNCVNILNKENRLVDVSWNEMTDVSYYTDILVEVLSNKNYMLDLLAKATEKNIFFDSIKTKESTEKVIYEITVRVKNRLELERFLSSLETCTFVRKVRRK